jgi:DNA polymerase III subunit gamma/tau
MDDSPERANKRGAESRGLLDRAAADGYRVLARKYRPGTFAELIGQDAMVRTLTNAFAQGRIAQAYLLTGVRGVGKTTTARILARALNYEPKEGGGGGPTLDMPVLGRHCEAIMESRHIDVIEMDAASHNGVDDVRQINEAVRYTPVSARYKIYILDEVHMFSGAAFNALLKTLEEPPPHVKFIFATTEVRKVPVTVLSRCQRFDLKRVEADAIVRHLSEIADKEKAKAEPEALALIARAAEGSVRDSLSLFDHAIAHGGGTVKAEEVRTMLGLADRARVIDLFESLMKGDIAAVLGEFRAQYEIGADPAVILTDLAEFTHLLTRFKVLPATADDRSLIEAERKRGREMAAGLSIQTLSRAWQMLTKGIFEVQGSGKPAQAAEMVLVRLAYAADLPTPDEALRALREGEGDGGGAPSAGAKPSDGGPRLSLAADGGGATARAIRQPAREPEVSAKALPVLARLEDIAALAATKRDLKLKHAVEHYLRLVGMEEGRLEVAFTSGAPSNLAGELGAKLTEWTGKRWFVTVSREAGGETLATAAAAAREAKKRDVRSDPLVEAVLKRFPGAEIVAVTKPGAADAAPELEAGDSEMPLDPEDER